MNNININSSNNNNNKTEEEHVVLNIPLLLNKSQKYINVNYGSISPQQTQLPQQQPQQQQPIVYNSPQPYQYQYQQPQPQPQLQNSQLLNNVIVLKKNKNTLLFDKNVYYTELTPYISPSDFIDVIDLVNRLSDEALFEKSSSSSSTSTSSDNNNNSGSSIFKIKLFDLIFLICFIAILIFFLVVKLYNVAIVISVLLVLIAFMSKVIYFFIKKSTNNNSNISISVEQGYENFFSVLSQKYNPLVFKGVFKKIESTRKSCGFEYSQTSLIIEYPTYIKTPYVFHNPNDHTCYKQINNNNNINSNSYYPILPIDKN